MKIRNPRNGAYDYTLLVDDKTQVESKVDILRSNQKKWQLLAIEQRAEIMTQWLQIIEKHEEEIVNQLSIDTARLKISQVEYQGTVGLIKSWIMRAPQLMKLPEKRPSFTAPSVMIQQQRVAYPVVGVISPWNFPLLLALIDAIPALLAGSSVLLKPSEVTPRFVDPLVKTIEAIPELAKVFQIVRGGPETGKAVVANADAICFTGSVETGKHIAAASSARLIPAFLELGGKDPAIVLADADLEIATDAILRSCVGATGQACQSLERIYVDESIFESFIQLITKKAEEVTLTTNPTTGQMGPLIFEKQAVKIQQQIDAAVAEGALLHTGGKVENIDGGLWCRPTVLSNVNHSMDVMNEETFGPIIPIMKFKTEEEAIELANDSIYGLSASVFSKNQEQALAVASQIEAGGISINDGSLTNRVYDAEKHAFKQSGFNGSRMGDAGFTRFFKKKAMLIQTEKPQTMAGFEESN
ncbi:aldehyde dehydrogenase family protein [Spongiivirga sp. MCCC 1A20706]|uniref:aldehyde dehydrogenase family protein n=1 Tax=Spongiivirga sp. MCCC 1A20706 TaxID=3160963 RepID=UPI003977CF14